MTREIVLRGGERALVDDDDFERLANYRWSLHSQGYAQRRSGRHRIYMHVVVGGPRCDHRNGNKLDNRRENLRPATMSQNAANSRVRSDSRSRLKGVSLHAASGLWRARVRLHGAVTTTYHETAEEAGREYDRRAAIAFGAFARLNFVPDAGGDTTLAAELNAALDEAEKELTAP